MPVALPIRCGPNDAKRISMRNWNKKELPPEAVKSLCKKYSLDALSASILMRRGITEGRDLMWFLEDDARFLHSPFEFAQMEDAVDRILAAKEEGEKVLIFGDRDVDGITATAVLFGQLERMGIDVSWRLPSGDDVYGVSMEAVDDFAKDFGTLLISVDCGISCVDEIAHANEFGINTIITDHHNPPEILPPAEIILNPKCADSGYPFAEISGCAVAFKLAQALRFSQTELYKEEICLLNTRTEKNSECEKTIIECAKVRNLVRVENFVLEIDENSFTQSAGEKGAALFNFLKGEHIFVWDAKKNLDALKNIFSSAVEFNLFDIRPECAKIIPQVSASSLEQIQRASKIARYENSTTELDALFNIFVTYLEKKISANFPAHIACDESDLQLVTLSALSDIMPLKNENRIFARRGLSSLNCGKARQGLAQILARQKLLNQTITSSDLAWSVIPILNASGRLGMPEVSLQLFLENDARKSDEILSSLFKMNEERKRLVDAATDFLGARPEKSLAKFGGKICLVSEEKIDRGVLGLIATKLLRRTGAPSIVITKVGANSEDGAENFYIGSMRSDEKICCTEFLDKFGDIYINHGGHAAAAGFSISEKNYELFLQKIHSVVDATNFNADSNDAIQIDAEIPHQHLTEDLMKIIDNFEPYGNEFRQFVFITRGAKIVAAQIIGKTEPAHLKLTLEIGEHKWPALWWGAAEKLNAPFKVGDKIDFLYNYERNVFNGVEGRRLVILDAKKI